MIVVVVFWHTVFVYLWAKCRRDQLARRGKIDAPQQPGKGLVFQSNREGRIHARPPNNQTGLWLWWRSCQSIPAYCWPLTQISSAFVCPAVAAPSPPKGTGGAARKVRTGQKTGPPRAFLNAREGAWCSASSDCRMLHLGTRVYPPRVGVHVFYDKIIGSSFLNYLKYPPEGTAPHLGRDIRFTARSHRCHLFVGWHHDDDWRRDVVHEQHRSRWWWWVTLYFSCCGSQRTSENMPRKTRMRTLAFLQAATLWQRRALGCSTALLVSRPMVDILPEDFRFECDDCRGR